MRAWKIVVPCWLTMEISMIAGAAELTSFGTDNHNDKGQAISVSVRCPSGSNMPVKGYVSEDRQGLAKQDHRMVTGRDGLVLLVPKDWWYKIVQIGDRCAATVALAPHLRFTR